MYRPKVLIAEDYALLREAFQTLLEQECEVVGSVADGRALLDVTPTLKPDIILLDIMMPLLNGLEAGHQLKRLMPTVKLVFLTINEDPDIARRAFRMGASGYLLKHCAGSELSQAIREVMGGKRYITPLITQGMGDTFPWGPLKGETEPKLTARQKEVLQLLAEGYTMKEVATLLRVTPRTVAFHKYRLMEEFRLKTNAGLLQFAMRHGLISDFTHR